MKKLASIATVVGLISVILTGCTSGSGNATATPTGSAQVSWRDCRHLPRRRDPEPAVLSLNFLALRRKMQTEQGGPHHRRGFDRK